MLQILQKRGKDTCPKGYNPCSNMGNPRVCCENGLNCTRDDASNLACCPTGVVCTGTLSSAGGGAGGPGMTTATATGSGGGSGGGGTTRKTSSTSSFMFPQPTSATQTKSGSDSQGQGQAQGPEIVGSTLSDAAYPFIYVPTTFANSATCAAYYSACQSEFAKCTSALEHRYGVTVAGGGGAGVTVPGAAEPSAATATCSSLSMEACHGLQLGNCNSYGGGGGAASSNAGYAPGRSRSRTTGGMSTTSCLRDLVLGLVVAVTGMFI